MKLFAFGKFFLDLAIMIKAQATASFFHPHLAQWFAKDLIALVLSLELGGGKKVSFSALHLQYGISHLADNPNEAECLISYIIPY
jgi:hypothetical protein